MRNKNTFEGIPTQQFTNKNQRKKQIKSKHRQRE
jgi:hypothetical protein